MSEETIRSQIKEIIAQSGNPSLATLEVCLFLGEELDLAANGWFDNDPYLRKVMNGSPAVPEEEAK
jgi:DNA topoisomerase VI subunit A